MKKEKGNRTLHLCGICNFKTLNTYEMTEHLLQHIKKIEDKAFNKRKVFEE